MEDKPKTRHTHQFRKLKEDVAAEMRKKDKRIPGVAMWQCIYCPKLILAT